MHIFTANIATKTFSHRKPLKAGEILFMHHIEGDPGKHSKEGFVGSRKQDQFRIR